MLVKKLIYIIKRIIIFIYGSTHKIENAVLFQSFGGKQYSDNPRAISEALHKMYPEHRIIWVLNDSTDSYGVKPNYINVVRYNTMEYLKRLATSCVFVTNEAIQNNIKKRKKQFFVQTWHGDRVPKKVLYDAWEGKKRPIPIIDGKVTDLCIAGSDLGESVFRSAFRYNGAVLKVGMPRNDCLVSLDERRVEAVRSRLSVPKGKKIFLYAPTFRDNSSKKQVVNVNLKRILTILEKDGDQWVCLIRSHSASEGLEYDFSSSFVDVSKYPDMADLLCIADMLITDYSSSAGDFILRKKATILAMFDLEEYERKCRSFNISFEDSRFLIAKTQEELENIILTYTEEDYAQNCTDVMNYFSVIETGRSADTVSKKIHEHIVKVFEKK